MRNKHSLSLIALTIVLTAGTACSKKVAHAPVPPPPPPPNEAPRSTPPATEAARSTPAATPVATPVAKSTYPDAATRARIDELLARIQDAYFDYDAHHLRPDAEKTLTADAHELGVILQQYPDYKLTVEGYCDERGSAEYNIALGDARARAAKEYLVAVGVPAAQLDVVSFGKERQVCSEADEACWQKNRRVHIVAQAR